MNLNKPDASVTEGAQLPCVTLEPKNANRFLLKRQSAYVPHSNLLVQDVGEMEGSDHWGHHYFRQSSDHGETWTSFAPLAPQRKSASGRWLRMGESTFLESPSHLYRIYNLHEYPDTGFQSDIWWYNRIYLQRWETGEFSSPVPLELDEETEKIGDFWRYGRNALAISFCRPFVSSTGEFILPLQWIPEIPEYKDPILRWRAGCLIGREQNGKLVWKPGGFVDLPPIHSVRGIFEPAMAELNSGELLMVARASNGRNPDIPFAKWTSLSADGGRHWTPPTPLEWTGGTPVYSPSSGNALHRTPSGKLVWIGNISSEPAQGNRPRHPLILAEVRVGKKVALDPATVRVIDCRRAEESDNLQLSNFKIYTDRQSSELVLTYARLEAEAPGLRGAGSVERRIFLE